MKSFVTLADRFAEPALKLIAALNLLFFLSFLLVLMLATSQARAEAPACTGKDLLAELQQTDPAAVAKLEAKAAETLNGKGTLWKIEKEGLAPSWLFGTIHMTDPRVTSLTPTAQAAYDGAKTVVIETTDILDQAKTMGQLAQEPDLMMFTDGSTLTSKLSTEDAAALEAGLKARGIPLSSRRQDETMDADRDGGAAGLRDGAQDRRRRDAGPEACDRRQGCRQGAVGP